MFIEETLADGDLFIRGNSGCGGYNFAASVQISAQKNVRRPVDQARQA